MKKTAIHMGMPATVWVVDKNAKEKDIDDVFSYFHLVDEQFSTYKPDSEISRINRGELSVEKASDEVKKIFTLCEKTAKETNGYFTIDIDGKKDPSGIVKGYAIHEGANILRQKGYTNFYIEIAGDIEVEGVTDEGKKWSIGIENPFNRQEIVKVIMLSGRGIATSGTYLRGQHIYDPIGKKPADAIASISVIGPNVYEADRFATAAFAMGENGIHFIEQLPGFEGYMITKEKKGILTSGFETYGSS